MKPIQLSGIRTTSVNQGVTTTDLNVASAAWKSNLQQFHRAVSAPGIIVPKWNLRPKYRDASTFDLTSGAAFAPSFSVASNLKDLDFPGVQIIKPSYVEFTELPRPGGHLSPVDDWAEGRIQAIPVVSASPSLPVFKDPVTGGSLLLGSLSQRTFIWLVYYSDVDVPNLVIDGTMSYSAFVDSFRIATTTAQAFQTYADSAVVGSLPAFLTSAFISRRAILLGAIDPVGGAIKEDSFQLIPEPYVPATGIAWTSLTSGDSWPYPMLRPEGGLLDTSLRYEIETQDIAIGVFPSRFVENRYYNQGSSSSVTKSFFGDLCVESGLKVISAPSVDYTGTVGDNILTQSSDPSGGPYTGLKHFPYTILSVIGADAKDYTSYANISPMKRYVSFSGALGVPLNQTFTVTYGWINVCEPYLDTSTTPNQIVLNQPLDNEYVVVGTSVITTLEQLVKRASVYPHFPGEAVISVSKYDGLPTLSPKHLIVPATASSLTGTVYPIAQPLSPTGIVVYCTSDTTSYPGGVTVQIYGISDTGERVTETLTVSSSSRQDLRQNMASGVADWSGWFEVSTYTYQCINKLVFSGGGSAYCCVLSMETINNWYEVPVCSFVFNTSGTYILPTFKDLRRKSLYIQGSLTAANDQGTTTDGTILVEVTAGEPLSKGHIVYLKSGDGKAYQALAQNQNVDNDDLEQVKVLGVVYPRDLAAGSVGTVLCRGIFGFGTVDTVMRPVYDALTPGATVLSKDTKGTPVDLLSLTDWIKSGNKPYTPVVRVIETLGDVVTST